MEFIKKVSSKTDKVEKYVFKNGDGFIVEFSYIDNNTNKDIICVSTHTICNLGCKFCHTTDYIGKIISTEVEHEDLFDGIDYIIKDLNLNRLTLLISFMGCGDPVLNVYNVINTMLSVKNTYATKNVRFAVATCMPKNDFSEFFRLTELIKKENLTVKMHLSLHYTTDALRKEWMPNALDIKSSLAAMDFYHEATKNPVEIHYALIDGVNDTDDDMIALAELLEHRNFNVKFLHYNEKNTIEAHASSRAKYDEFDYFLWIRAAIKTEYYSPPGPDVGASCGMFLMDEYLQNGINVPTDK